MHHGSDQRIVLAGLLDERLEARTRRMQRDLRQDGARTSHLLARREHPRLAADDFVALLVGAETGERDMALLGILGRDRDAARDRIAHTDRATEMQGLVEVDRPRAGQAGAQHGGYQRATPHAMGDDAVEMALLCVVIVEMGGVHVSRHHREDVDILTCQAARDLGAVADGDLVEGAVLDIIHFEPLSGAGSGESAHMRIWRPASTYMTLPVMPAAPSLARKRAAAPTSPIVTRRPSAERARASSISASK